MIQIRDVPDETHSILKARAAKEGMSLSDFLKRELERVAEKPTMREWLERVGRGKPILGGPGTVEILRELRDGR